MVRATLTHALALYLGAGLFGGLILAAHLPLNALGVAFYALTWPEHVYCADPQRDCATILARFPPQMRAWFFNLEGE